MEVPYYRAMLQVVEQRMHMSRQTLMNWAHKPEQYLLKIKEAMKVELQKLREGFYGQTVGLMEKAINYMTTFWNQLFMYLKDGRYTIDNLAAERAIRPLTIERKNSNSFCSHAGVQMSALYHTIIATCRMQGYSVLEYLKTFFTCIIQGRRDYENLMPATIGISKMIKNK
jgi:hypothetical protein